jgi:hypothetical protein
MVIVQLELVTNRLIHFLVKLTNVSEKIEVYFYVFYVFNDLSCEKNEKKREKGQRTFFLLQCVIEDFFYVLNVFSCFLRFYVFHVFTFIKVLYISMVFRVFHVFHVFQVLNILPNRLVITHRSRLVMPQAKTGLGGRISESKQNSGERYNFFKLLKKVLKHLRII